MTVISVPYHLDERLPGLGVSVAADHEVTAPLPDAGDWDRLAVLYLAVASAVAAACAAGACPVVLSGDCTTALGTVAGLQAGHPDVGVVWFDAHGDVQTPETTASGYLGGMPLRLLTGYRPELIADRLGLRPVPESAIVLAGARDLDPPEVSYLAGAQLSRSEVAGLTAASVPELPLYVHVDLDVLDPAEVPGLRFPAPAGPSAGELAAALRLLTGTGRVVAIGLACTWQPGSGAPASLAPVLRAALGPSA
jgi:arginase